MPVRAIWGSVDPFNLEEFPVRRTPLAALAGLIALTALAGAPASANTIDSFTLSPSSIPGGSAASVTATATWTATAIEDRDISIAMPQALYDAGARWTAVSANPSQTACVLDMPPTEAGCLWRPASATETVTLTAELSIPANVPVLLYDLTAQARPQDTNGTLSSTLTILSRATPSISVAPASTPPGSTATATGTFTALTTGDIVVLVDVTGTGGNGTLGSPVVATGLEDCALDSTGRLYRCTWRNAVVGETRSIQVPIVVGAGAVPGQSWTVNACVNPNTAASDCDSTSLSIVAPATASPTPTATTTASPTPTATTTASPSATSSASPTDSPETSEPDESEVAALPTAVPAGEGPGDGSLGLPVALLASATFGILGFLGLVTWRSRRDG